MSVRDRLARFRASQGSAQGSAQSRVPSGGYSGAPDLPLQDPGFMDPLNYIPVPGAQTPLGRAGGRAMGPVTDVLEAGIRGAGRVARPVLGAAGGAISHMPIVGPMIRGAAKGFRAGLPQQAAEAARTASAAPLAQATAAEMQPLVGRAEAGAFREGGQAALEAERQATKGAAKGAIEEGAGAAASRVAKEAIDEVPKGFHRVVQKAGEFLRKNAKRTPKSTPKPAAKLGSAASRVSPLKVVKEPESMRQVENGLNWIKRNVADNVQAAAAKRWIKENVPADLQEHALNAAKKMVSGL